MNLLNSIIYWIGSLTTIICIVVCLVLFFTTKSKNAKGERNELENKTTEKP